MRNEPSSDEIYNALNVVLYVQETVSSGSEVYQMTDMVIEILREMNKNKVQVEMALPDLR